MVVWGVGGPGWGGVVLGGVVEQEMVQQRRAARQRGGALQQQMKGGWSSGERRVRGAIHDGRVAETRMGDVSGRRAVVRLGWVGLDNDLVFGFKVLLWRWRWLMAWELSVFRAMYTLRVKGEEVVSFMEWDGD